MQGNKNCRGATPPYYGLLAVFFLVSVCMVAPVNAGPFNQTFDADDEAHYNITTKINTVPATPIEIWATAAILGLLLFLYSLPPKATEGELEHSAIVSVLAWMPIGFTAATSFAVERITGMGVTSIIENAPGTNQEFVLMEQHTIYHFNEIGILYGIFFLFAIINTFRILSLHKSLRLQQDSESRGYSR